MKRLLAYAAIYLLWGASFLAIRIVMHALPPFFSAGIRFTAAGTVLVVITHWKKYPLPKGREWMNVMLLAVTLFVGDYALLFWAERMLTSGMAAVTAATIPAQVFLLEWSWLKRVRVTILSAAGLTLGFIGVVTLIFSSRALSYEQTSSRYTVAGLLAASCWAFGTVLSTRLALPQSRPVNAGWQMLLGGIALLALSLITGELVDIHLASMTLQVYASMGYLIVFASLVAFSAYVYLLQREPALRVASYAYVNPVVALLLGTWVGGEVLSRPQAIGCSIVIAGILATLAGKRNHMHSRR